MSMKLHRPWKKNTARAVGFLVPGRRWAITRIAGTAFFGGLTEALFLIAVTRAAFAITDGDDRIGIVSGWFVPIHFALVLAVALIVIRVALAGYTSWQSAKLATGVVADLRHRLSRAFLDSSWEVQQAQKAGSLQEFLTGHANQATNIMNGVIQGVVAAANLVALLGMAVAVDPAGAVVLVVCVTGLGLLLRPLRTVVRGRARAVNTANMEFAVSVNELSELGLELHVFHVQEQAQARIGEAAERVRKAARRLQFANGLSTPLYSGLAYVAIVSALAVVAVSEVTSFTSLGAAMLVMLRSLGYAQAAQSAYIGVSGAVPAIEYVQRRLQLFEAGHRSDGGLPIDRVGAITMEGVSFAYGQGQPVLSDISFTIAPQEVVGIVGPSGAGKSTLVQLLLGLRDPSDGRVLAGGREIRTLNRGQWARSVTFVPQSAHLIAGTIADNIRFFRDDVTQEDLERAARLAHLHDDICAFPEGYGRQVGKHGGQLSGGQQQRLCIARALVENPDALILDEPTSALDVRSEHLIRSTLLGLKDRMTVIVIAHRLSTLAICDRIMVIKDGQLKDFDTPSQLEQSSGFYREALALSGMR